MTLHGLVPCECTIARKQQRNYEQAFGATNLGPARARQTFDAFDPSKQPAAFRTAWQFVNEHERWLVLLGPTGTGKSHLLSACANELINQGRRPLYWCCPDLWQHFHEGYKLGDFAARMEAVKTAEVLLLDDFGADNDTDDRAEKLFTITNYRMDHDLPLAISTNLTPSGMSPRIRSRLMDRQRCLAVSLDPVDYRTGERYKQR